MMSTHDARRTVGIILISIAFLMILATPATAQAVETAPTPSFGGLLLQAVISLVLVSALAWAVIRFGLSRWLRTQQPDPTHLDILSSAPLGPRRTIYLVRALDRVLVIGASEAGLQVLSDMGEGSVEKWQPKDRTEEG
jgi:flagellar protein FliO/FliZ